MLNQADIIYKDKQYYVSGELTFTTVMSLLEKSLALFSQQTTLVLDFSQVTSCNSAGLALMVEWLQYANTQHKSLKLEHLSADILSIAKAAGVDKLLAPVL